MTSPTKLKANTVRNKAAAGKPQVQGAVSRSLRPITIMLPQVGVGGGIDRPRKDNPPSTTIQKGTDNDAMDNIVMATLGSNS